MTDKKIIETLEYMEGYFPNEILGLIKRQKDEIERLKAVSNAELDTVHTLGDDYEKALEEINQLKAEVERLQERSERAIDNLKAVLNERADHTEAVKEFWNDLQHYIHKTGVQFGSLADEYTFERYGNLLLKKMH